jgi:ribosomal-protein-alanine acetyltransferase
MNLRRATLADLESILLLERRAENAAHWSESHYRNALADAQHLFIAAEEVGKLLGFLVARAAGPEWELQNVAVAAAAQRRGIGKELVRELLREVRPAGAEAVFLEVRESNAAARGLYESAGFVVTGRRRGYYRDPDEDALIYRHALAPSSAKTVE